MRLNLHQFNLLNLAVLLVLTTHFGHLPLWMDAAGLAIVGARWLQRRYRPQWGATPVWIRLPLTLGLPVAVIAQYGTLLGLEPGSVLAIGMLILKLSESEKVRDARAALTFAGFVLMAALLFERNLINAAHVALAVVPLFVCMRALEPRPTDAVGGGPDLWHSTRSTVLGLTAAIPLTLVVFVFMPRLAQPLWGAPSNEEARTGVSDTMAPGQFAELMVDDSPAFRVQFASGQPPLPAQRYWRGLVLNRFDGLTWTRTESASARLEDGDLKLLSAPIEYELTLEPTQQRWLFPLDVPTRAPERFARNADLTLVGFRPLSAVQRFSLSSVLEYRLEGLTPMRRQAALNMPYGFNPRLQELGAQWRQQYGGDAQRIVQAALKLYHDEFSYTLTPPVLGRDGMDDFLFETRAGYCEHFSSSFANLMRAAGVPARVVVGYQGGYWNADGSYLLIRQSDAHAWNEVWLDGRWQRIDPTAAVRPERVALGSRAANSGETRWYRAQWLLDLRNRWDLANQMWNEVIVQFDTLRQQGLLRNFGVERANWNQLALAFGIASSILMLLGLYWALRRERQQSDTLDQAYHHLCRRLAAAGVARAAQEGPISYLRRVCQHLPQAAAELEGLFADYVRLRYALPEPDAAGSREFSRAVRRFKPAGNHS
ncbi:uncharacterized protein DUF4129 [Tahibacter aquaticus]|uniref:Uncharacterized protein DUF4129 n=1 Tax=Tahibacter aquaticus TaxID=520092 RepID=A0A4R6YNS6_9GAMM|nr:DUF3488 and transglutaminase-like domain-containing protein [Tahibacter aquaticus]TDR39361.1 uncharacterized protein DUF4129 [Tahibacter aquaticus]